MTLFCPLPKSDREKNYTRGSFSLIKAPKANHDHLLRLWTVDVVKLAINHLTKRTLSVVVVSAHVKTVRHFVTVTWFSEGKRSIARAWVEPEQWLSLVQD